jgi:F-type H+-transporting ATPase subunit delta
MAELATIARPYAEALFQATPAAEADSAAGWLDEMAQIAAQDSLLQFADNPKVTADQVFGVIQSVAKSAWPDAAKNFLQILIQNGRLVALPEIAMQYRNLKNTRTGINDAVVYSAFPIEQAELTELALLLEKRFARKLNLTVQLQPELIGGIRVAVGDEVLDTSIKARLEQMKAALTA